VHDGGGSRSLSKSHNYRAKLRAAHGENEDAWNLA